MVYVAFLRGINVGGNTKVEMARLKRVLESLGYQKVKTYINSGNVIFSTDNKAILDKEIEQAIVKEFSLNVPVVVRTLPEIQLLNKEIPGIWANDKEQKTDILFLWNEVNTKDVLKQVSIKPNIDNVIYTNGAIVWNVSRQNQSKSGLLEIIGTPLYKKTTVRNVNTVRKVLSLMTEIETVE